MTMRSEGEDSKIHGYILLLSDDSPQGSAVVQGTSEKLGDWFLLLLFIEYYCGHI